MFHLIGSIASLAIAAAASIFGYWQARNFTQNKLRYVDAVHRTGVPVLAGLGALIIATPLALFLPLVSMWTAVVFGGSVALGVAAGTREIRKRLGAG